MKLITEDLITSVKVRSMVPISQNTFDTDVVVQVLNEEMNTRVVPGIMSIRENYWLTSKLVALTANLDHYAIPTRAIGDALKDVWYADSSGNRQYQMNQIGVPHLSSSAQTSNRPVEYLLKGDEVLVFQKPNVSQGYIEFWYYRRINDIAKTSSCAKITAIASAGGTTTFTVDTDLTASLSVGSKLDIVSSQSPFLLWSEDAVITAITTTTIAIATISVSNVVGTVEPQVDDYICPARKTNIPMMPEEWHPVLAQCGAIRLVSSLGDLNKATLLKNELKEELLPNCLKLITNRVESGIEPILNPNGILNAMGFGGSRY